MNDIFQFINQGWVGSLLGLIGIVVGVAGIYSFKIARSIAKPVYQRYSIKLISEDDEKLPEEVAVFYNDKPVEKLTRTVLVFWNNGTEVLRGDDIVLRDPVRFEFSTDAQILNAHVIRKTKEANRFQLHSDVSKPYIKFIKFDYLDPKDGAVVEILHTSQKRYPTFYGSIRGIPKGITDLGRLSPTYFQKHSSRKSLSRVAFRINIVFPLMILIGLLFVTYGFLPESLAQPITDWLRRLDNTIAAVPYIVPRAFSITLGILYLLPGYILITRRQRFPNSLAIGDDDT